MAAWASGRVFTAHAEVNAIRNACAQLGRFSLEGAVICTSCEPCPLCMAPTCWTRISRINYASTTAGAAAAVGFDDARAVFAEWDAMPDKAEY